MRKYALWFFRQMSAVRGRLLLRIIAGLLQVALGLYNRLAVFFCLSHNYVILIA